MRVAVLGAGPIGLEAAAAAARARHEVVVLEAVARIGGAAAAWPHVRWYTPWRMNTTPLGRETVGLSVPLDDTPTGGELLREYLQPLARWSDVRLSHRVLGVGPWDAAGGGWRLLVATPSGETWMQAEAVLDCTGCPRPNPTGPSGLPAPGEASAAVRGLIHFGPVSARGFEGRRVLLVGDGLDAARVARDLDAAAPRPLISWIGGLTPGEFSPGDDTLPERVALRAVAADISRRCDRWDHAWVDRYRITEDGRVEVRVSTGDTLFVDAVIACTGFQPGDGLRVGPGPAPWRTLGSRAAADTGDFLLERGLSEIDGAVASLAVASPG